MYGEQRNSGTEWEVVRAQVTFEQLKRESSGTWGAEPRSCEGEGGPVNPEECLKTV